MGKQEAWKEKYAALDRIIIRRHGERDQLIRILQEAQEVFGYLPEEVQTYIAAKMHLPVSEVNGVVTFYSLFTTEPRGRFAINVCTGTACYVQGGRQLLEHLQRELMLSGDNNTTADGLFTVKSTRCIGACGLAPVLTVNGAVHGKLTAKDVPQILRAYQRVSDAAGAPAKKMEVHEADQNATGFGTNQDQPPA